MENGTVGGKCDDARFSDVTQQFKEACSQLGVGELAYGSKFSFQDAMSAIEIMDPKMDAGVAMPRRVVYLKEALENNLLQLSDFDGAEVLGIMDETLAAMVNWLEGDTLAQTIFINMYMHCEHLIKDPTLRVFCHGSKQLIMTIKSIIRRGCVFEEEDFCMSDKGMPLDSAEDIAESRVTGMLKERDEDISRELKRSVDGSCNELLAAMQYRLRFVRSMLLLFIQFNRAINNDSQQAIPQLKQDATKYVDQLTALCDSMKSTLHLGKIATGKDNPREQDYGLAGFEPFLNQPLLPPTIPRYRRITDRETALQYYYDLIQRMKHILTIYNFDVMEHLHVVWKFFSLFSQHGGENTSCVLTRSLLLLLYLPPQKERIYGVMPKVDAFKESLKIFTSITTWSTVQKALVASPIKDQIDLLIRNCATNLFELPVTYSFNRSRQRNRLEHLIESTYDLYEECNRADAILRQVVTQIDPKLSIPSIFSSYVVFYLFHMMWDYLTIGFELELYVLHELPYIFDFLSDVILYNFANHLSELERYRLIFQNDLSKNRKGKKNASGGAGRGKDQETFSVAQYLAEIKCHYNLAVATFFALAGFIRDGKLSIPELSFGLEETRYTRRFAPLLSCGWFADYDPYPKFNAKWTEALAMSPEQLYSKAIQYYNLAVSCIENYPPSTSVSSLPSSPTAPSIANFTKLAKRNAVVCKLLVSGHKRGAEVPVNLLFTMKDGAMVFPMFQLG